MFVRSGETRRNLVGDIHGVLDGKRPPLDLPVSVWPWISCLCHARRKAYYLPGTFQPPEAFHHFVGSFSPGANNNIITTAHNETARRLQFRSG